MAFANFYEPIQINELKIKSLPDFFGLISINGELYSKLDKFLGLGGNNKDKCENYEEIIATEELQLKIEFANNRIKDKDCLTNLSYEVFYRGILDVSYKTIPSAFRGNNLQYEDRFINDIRVSNPDFVQDKTYIDELSALQHYGCPTRLLDLTRNPLVALYFACEDALNSNSNVDGSVLLFLSKEEDILHSNSDRVLILTALSHLSEKHKKQLFTICENEIKTIGSVAKLSGQTMVRKKSVQKLYQEILRVSNFEKDILCIDLLKSFYVQPAYNNLRIRTQQGLFLLNGLGGSVQELELRNENKIFAKVIVPYDYKKQILMELDQIGINRKTLFPEIEDTVEYLKNKYK